MKRHQCQFLQKMVPHALDVQYRHGVPASVALAQAALESNWGRSGLARKANNFFGMKKARRHKEFVLMPTSEFQNGKWVRVQAPFARFAGARESFEDWARLLSRSSRYKRCLAAAANPVAFARCIQQAGYATDPKYADKLAALIGSLNLTQYDAPARTAKA